MFHPSHFTLQTSQGSAVPQLEHMEAIEKRLWGAADTLRANSNYASNERSHYFHSPLQQQNICAKILYSYRYSR
jgi:hypothetical protein